MKTDNLFYQVYSSAPISEPFSDFKRHQIPSIVIRQNRKTFLVQKTFIRPQQQQ